MKFSDIPAHEQVKNHLRAIADSGKIPHAIMLHGPAGVGKFALARAFAQYIHCNNHTPDGDSCGVCPSCRQHQSLNHIDTIYSFPVVKREGSSGKPTVSDDYLPQFREYLAESPWMDFDLWRSSLSKKEAQPAIYVDESALLLRKLRFTAHGSKYKIVLMWLPERMNVEAANKLLKLLEEPEPDTLFILTSNNPSLLLPTIVSRLQRVAAKPLPLEVLQTWLAENAKLPFDRAGEIAALAEGSISRALSILETGSESSKNDSSEFLNLFMVLMRLAWQRNIVALKKWSEEDVSAMGRELQMQFYDYCCRMMRENFMLNLHNPGLVRLTSAESAFCAKFSPFINERNVEKLYELFSTARAHIAGNCNAKIVNFDVAVKTILLLK